MTLIDFKESDKSIMDLLQELEKELKSILTTLETSMTNIATKNHNSTPKISPCPSCGCKETHLINTISIVNKFGTPYIFCPNCKYRSPEGKTYDEAVKKHNELYSKVF